MADVTDVDPGLGVMAHGLLNSMAVVTGTLITINEHPDIEPESLRYMLERARAHADLVSASLKDLAQGLPMGATAVLEDLDQRSTRRRQVDVDRNAG